MSRQEILAEVLTPDRVPTVDVCPDCGDPMWAGEERCEACWEANPRICYHCSKRLDESPLADIFSNEKGEDVCGSCYARDVEPYEVWSDDEQEVIGYDWSRQTYGLMTEEALHAKN